MIARLDVAAGHRVLELGSGSGWNAALLCELAGEQAVTTVEVDPALREQAHAALTAAGYAPTVVLGDGLDGYAPGAPYDRITSTMAVRRVPGAWVAAQWRPPVQVPRVRRTLCPTPARGPTRPHRFPQGDQHCSRHHPGCRKPRHGEDRHHS